MEPKDKELYETPTIMVMEVKTEGIVCISNPEGTGNGFPDGWFTL